MSHTASTSAPGGDRAARVERQPRQQRTQPPAGELDELTVALDLQRPEDPDTDRYAAVSFANCSRSVFLENLPTDVFGTSSMISHVVRDPPLRDALGEELLELVERDLLVAVGHDAR